MTTAFASLNDVAMALRGMPEPDNEAQDAARARQDALTKPRGALGRLEDLAVFMAGWQGHARPQIRHPHALVFAGNHGVTARGVSPFPADVTAQMVANFEAGGAAINQLCKLAGADLTITALELDRPTGDFTVGPAMSEAECLAALNTGARVAAGVIADGADVLVLGEMGIGNSTVSAALAHAVCGGATADWVGPGTGADAEGMSLKAQIVAGGVARHAGASGLQILAALGGREQAALCGAVIAARQARIPVLLDGYICTAAVAPLWAAAPSSLDHCLIGHTSAEPGHVALCNSLGKAPLLDLGMALGEGTGAALALQILRGALACHNGMATFAEAGVAGA